MRAFIFIAALAFAAQSAAQTTPTSDLQRAAHMLAADWRPFRAPAAGADAPAAFAAACAGVGEELAAIDAQTPEDLNPAALAAIRPPRGFIIVPTGDDPAAAYIFPNAELRWIASGLATVHVVDAAPGRISLTDSNGQIAQLQLGVAGGRGMMRILQEGAEPLLYVACAPSV